MRPAEDSDTMVELIRADRQHIAWPYAGLEHTSGGIDPLVNASPQLEASSGGPATEQGSDDDTVANERRSR
jgi:hypothetical protein